VDYKKQCFLFYKLFKKNYEEIKDCYIKNQKNIIEKKIDCLKKDLENINFDNRTQQMGYVIDEEIDECYKIINNYEKEKLQLKEDCEKFKKCDEYININKNKIEYLESIK
jgi:hypothetical protein